MRRQLLAYSLIAITIGVVLFATNFRLLGGISEYEGADNAIHVMNADGSSVKRITSYDQNSMAVWSPDSSKIAFLFSSRDDRGNDGLYVMSADGAHKVKLNDSISGSVEGFDWSPDSSQIVFANCVTDDLHPTSGGKWSIYIINADGTNLRQLIDDQEAHLINWSPDGSKIAFRSDSDGWHELYTMSPDGSNMTRLTDFSSYNSNIIPIFHWSPDGSKIVFSVILETSEVFLINSDGSNQAKIMSDDGLRGVIGWTPDSGKILFLQQNSGELDIQIIDTDGYNETNLTANLINFSIYHPMLSPDGQRLLFSSDSNDYSNNEINNLDIYVMNIDDSTLTQLTHYERNNYSNTDAAWSPDGSKILFFTVRKSTISW